MENGHDDYHNFDDAASMDSLDESALEELVNKEGKALCHFQIAEKLNENLAKANDQAVTSLLVGNTSEGLVQLERIEKILEVSSEPSLILVCCLLGTHSRSKFSHSSAL